MLSACFEESLHSNSCRLLQWDGSPSSCSLSTGKLSLDVLVGLVQVSEKLRHLAIEAKLSTTGRMTNMSEPVSPGSAEILSRKATSPHLPWPHFFQRFKSLCVSVGPKHSEIHWALYRRKCLVEHPTVAALQHTCPHNLNLNITNISYCVHSTSVLTLLLCHLDFKHLFVLSLSLRCIQSVFAAYCLLRSGRNKP